MWVNKGGLKYFFQKAPFAYISWVVFKQFLNCYPTPIPPWYNHIHPMSTVLTNKSLKHAYILKKNYFTSQKKPNYQQAKHRWNKHISHQDMYSSDLHTDGSSGFRPNIPDNGCDTEVSHDDSVSFYEDVARLQISTARKQIVVRIMNKFISGTKPIA